MNKRILLFCFFGCLLKFGTAKTDPNRPYTLVPPIHSTQRNPQFVSYGAKLRYAMLRQLYGQPVADSFYTITRENFYTDFLPLTGGTLTGLLEGTAASFSGNFQANGTASFGLANFSNAITISRSSTAGASLVINRTSASYAATTLYQDNASSRWAVGTDGDGTADFKFYNHATGNYSFKIGYSTDLATFSGSAVFGGSVTGGNASFALGNFSNAVTVSRASTTGASFVINRTSASYAATTLYQDNASSRWTVGTDGDGGADFKFYDHATGNYSLKLGYGTDLATFTGSASFAGNVGIGTSPSGYKLDINGNSRLLGELNFGSASYPTRNQLAANYIQLAAPNDLNICVLGISNTLANLTTNYYGGGSSLPIAINSYPFTNQLFCATNSNVGVGTSSPSFKLDVNGSLRVSGAVNFGTSTNPDRNQLVPSYLRLTSPNDLNILDIGVTDSLVNIGSNYFGGGSVLPLSIHSFGNSNQLYLSANGNIGVGTASPAEKFCVNGNVLAKKLIVTQNGWSDYVFDSTYQLLSIADLEKFISQNKHLPDIPSAKQVELNGINVGDNQALLLKKIEELTLYVIKQQKQIEMLINQRK